MRRISFNFIYLLLFLFIGIFTSCEQASDSEIESPDMPVRLSLNISPLTRADEASPIEKVNSIRVIMTDATGRVEYNHKKIYESYDPDSEVFEYLTTVGVKHLYVIANEESIESFSIEGKDIPDNKSLSELLDGFTFATTGLEEYLTSLYFTPDYRNTIPASCYYELQLKEENEIKELYLVNVATKFYINFSNLRNDVVIFEKVAINSFASENYLIPKVGESQTFIKGDYWIDWLKKVSEDTNEHPDLSGDENSNDLINDKWGWLTDYSLPTENHEPKNLIAEGAIWEVEKVSSAGNTGEVIPGKLACGPFYFPESKNGKEEQSYSIEFEIQQTGKENITLSKDLPYLKSLFRNTYVIINVEMFSAVEEIYVEIKKWVEQDPVYGTIKPE